MAGTIFKWIFSLAARFKWPAVLSVVAAVSGAFGWQHIKIIRLEASLASEAASCVIARSSLESSEKEIDILTKRLRDQYAIAVSESARSAEVAKSAAESADEAVAQYGEEAAREMLKTDTTAEEMSTWYENIF